MPTECAQRQRSLSVNVLMADIGTLAGKLAKMALHQGLQKASGRTSSASVSAPIDLSWDTVPLAEQRLWLQIRETVQGYYVEDN